MCMAGPCPCSGDGGERCEVLKFEIVSASGGWMGGRVGQGEEEDSKDQVQKWGMRSQYVARCMNKLMEE